MGGGAMKRVKKKTKKGQKKSAKGGGRTTAKGTVPSPARDFRMPGLDPLADQLEKAGIDIPGLDLGGRND